MIKSFFIKPQDWGLYSAALRPFYERAVEPSKEDCTLQDYFTLFVKGENLIYVVLDDGVPVSFAQGQFVYYPRKTVFLVTLAGGKILHYDSAIDMLGKLVAAGGATELEAWCRPSMERLLRRCGFNKKYNVLRRVIRE